MQQVIFPSQCVCAQEREGEERVYVRACVRIECVSNRVCNTPPCLCAQSAGEPDGTSFLSHMSEPLRAHLSIPAPITILAKRLEGAWKERGQRISLTDYSRATYQRRAPTNRLVNLTEAKHCINLTSISTVLNRQDALHMVSRNESSCALVLRIDSNHARRGRGDTQGYHGGFFGGYSALWANIIKVAFSSWVIRPVTSLSPPALVPLTPSPLPLNTVTNYRFKCTSEACASVLDECEKKITQPYLNL